MLVWSRNVAAHHSLPGPGVGAYARHTAMGDVQWVMAQWDAIMGGVK